MIASVDAHIVAMAYTGPPPYGPAPAGHGGPRAPAPLGRAATAAWKVLLTLGGAAGCTVLLFRPTLRDTAAWLVCGGAAGIFPLDRLLERFGVK